MKVGIVTYWFNRGQAVVGRHIRSALDDLGHETFVLARPTAGSFVKPGLVARDDRWAADGLTAASNFRIPLDEYLRWADANGLDAVFFVQNYQFDEIAALRSAGVRTIGQFMWEQFGPQHAPGVARAFDVLFACNQCDSDRYRSFGLDVRLVPWGCHPEDVGLAPERLPLAEGPVRFFYPGGYLSFRKPIGVTIEAFAQVEDPDLTLDFKVLAFGSWTPRTPTKSGAVTRAKRTLRRLRVGDAGRPVLHGVPEADEAGHYSRAAVVRMLVDACERDPRVRLTLGDLPAEEHFARMVASDLLLAPSRWEGLGLHLYEAVSLGLPTITCDAPPMNEVVHDGKNGLLVPVRVVGTTESGIDAVEPDARAMADAIRSAAEPRRRAELVEGTLARREELDWSRTVGALDGLLRAPVQGEQGEQGETVPGEGG
jgi:glycosyltransferase involved in cell wall biosynthesis